jgi:hypothetical protein
MTKKKLKAVRQGAVIDRGLAIKIRNRIYYPLPPPPNAIARDAMHPAMVVAMELNPCARIADNEPCPNIAGCVCRGGQCFYTLSQLRKMGLSI